MFDWNKEKSNKKIMHLEYEKPSVSVLRKQLELRLVELVERYQAQGLDIEWISVELFDGVDASVKLNKEAENA
ncbi:hypothetical protein [Acinetobacter bereziniae]|nr:hypothetical protein [Acinetobacter bereziniae]